MWRPPRCLSPSLPDDVFRSFIIPDLLTDHLHQLLVAPEAPEWHTFYVLPQVSLAFRDTCHALCRKIFGLEIGEDGKVIDDILGFALELWAAAKRPPERDRPVHEYTHAQLMSCKSLIQVYICTALAKSFLNLDVLPHIALQARAAELSDEGLDAIDMESDWGLNVDGAPCQRFKMRDDTMHRAYLPLTCAMKLCDDIRPERLAYVAAGHLADIVPLYATAPVMLKYTQDLETYVARAHRVNIETWVEWTCQTLGLIEGIKRLLLQMQAMGKMVHSFKRPTEIPSRVLRDTRIIAVLQHVAAADWGPYTEEIAERVMLVLEQLGADRPPENTSSITYCE